MLSKDKKYTNEHPKNKKSNIKIATGPTSTELKEYLKDEYSTYKKDMNKQGKKPLSYRRIKKILLEQVLPQDTVGRD